MRAAELKKLVLDTLDELKGQQLTALDVRALTDVMDCLVIVTGTSNRHVKALADKLRERVREEGLRPLGVEGEDGCEWILVDFGDVVVNIMLPATRDFYDLERLWRDVPEASKPGE